MDLQAVYVHHKNIKRRNYKERVLNVEHGSLTPIIFSTTGGAGPEAERHQKRIAQQIAMKRKEEYSHVIQYIRTRLRFNLLRSVLVAIGGERGKNSNASPISIIEFGMVPKTEGLKNKVYLKWTLREYPTIASVEQLITTASPRG